MDPYMVAFVIMGMAFLGAAWVPRVVHGRPLSLPFLYVAFGYLLFEAPLNVYLPNPLQDTFFVEHFTEILVIISLTGAGLKLARPVRLGTWGTTWRLMFVAMPICIALTAVVGLWALGLAPAAAILLGAVLAPTDPVLASDVQAASPGRGRDGETRFALTSEAGLNDGLAFPFTYLALAAAAASGGGFAWLGEWAWYDLAFRVAVGALVGFVVGKALAMAIFRMAVGPSLARTRDGFVVLAITLLSYGAAELAHGYGFLAVFVAALTVRHAERDHDYHAEMHAFAEGLERLLTAVMLILFGGLLGQGALSDLRPATVLVAATLVLVVRPLTALPSLLGSRLSWRQRGAISFFGIRGVGSLYYLAYALNHGDFAGAETLWTVVSLTILISIVVHGGSSSFVMGRLDDEEGSEGEEVRILSEATKSDS